MASFPSEIVEALRQEHLSVLGGFSTEDPTEHALDPTVRSLALIGPDEPTFWDHFKSSAEYNDVRPDPMDRWSKRVIENISSKFGLKPYFPFGGPPFAPFYSWALKTGRIYASPTKLLVHDTAGLFVSFRGALGLPYHVDFDDEASPCTTCHKPCLSACPVDAFAEGTYNATACRGELTSGDRQDCTGKGCAARRACPISQRFARVDEQSQFHMRSFI